MHERMLDKKHQPTFEDMLDYCGESREAWVELESFLQANYDLKNEIRFPYGKDYGWGKDYKHRTKHICDIHAEAGAFTVFFQIHTESIEKIKAELSDYALKVWDNKYPCGSGGWIRYRVTDIKQLADVQKLLTAKIKPKK